MGSETKKLISNSSIVLIGTLVGSFFSYLFNMLTGRLLGPELYGEFSALLSLTAILTVAGGAVLTVTMKYSSELYAKKEINALRKLFSKFSRYVLSFALILFVICLFFVKPIGSFFSIQSTLPIVITFSSFIFGFLIVVNRGVLQGGQKFLALSITNPAEMVIKFLLGIALIKFGFALNGAMAAVVIATAIVYLLTLLPLKKLFSEQGTPKSDFVFDKKEIMRYTLPALLSSVLLMVALNVDVILVKHYFDPETAGIYAAISTIAKIILYATAPVVGVMFPMISEKKTTGEKHYKLFLFSIILTITAALLILAAYMIAPGSVIKVLYGVKYSTYYYLLPKVGFFILLYALVNIMANYFLAIKNFLFLYIFCAALIIQLLWISLNHSSLEMVIGILIFTTGFLFIALMGYYLFTKKDQLAAYLRGDYE